MSDASTVRHLRWTEVGSERLNPLTERQLALGNQLMLARFLLKKDAEVGRHSHVHEQMSWVESGVLRVRVEDGSGEAGAREFELRPGEVCCIPPNVPHGVVALEDSVAFDLFTPPRAEWLTPPKS